MKTKPEERCLADYPDLFLAGFVHQVSKRLLPGVHLDHLHPVDDLVHQSDPPVSLGGSFDPQFGKLSTHPGLKRDG